MRPSVTPILAGLRLRCGACGKGHLFRSYLQLHQACPTCGRDMSEADTADGPAFFVGFGVLILMAPFLFIIPMTSLTMPIKIAAIGAVALAVTGLCLWLLPVAKAVLLNLQLHHDAREASFEDTP